MIGVFNDYSDCIFFWGGWLDMVFLYLKPFGDRRGQTLDMCYSSPLSGK